MASDSPNEPARRRFLKIATGALGGAIGAVLAVPLVRYVLHPMGRKTVRTADGPLDVLPAKELPEEGTPVKVKLVGADVRDAWTVADEVVLGSAWVRKTSDGSVVALSSVCPHLGCAIDYDSAAGSFKCPCHKSAFSIDGQRQDGPSPRDLDPLPTTVEDGTVKITFKRYKQNVSGREEV